MAAKEAGTGAIKDSSFFDAASNGNGFS